MRRAARWSGLAMLVLAGACASGGSDGGESPGAAASGGAPSLPTRDLTQLDGPSSWTGDIPCADCDGVRTSLTLFPNGTYRSQGAYLGAAADGDTIFSDFGRWILSDGRTRVQLRGSADVPGQFAVDPDGALQMLDPEGNPIDSKLNYRLAPVAQPIVIIHPARLVGAFAYMADAATFIECGSGLQFPVANGGDYLALERAYSSSGVRPGQPVPVRVRAHLDELPAMEGGTAVTVVIDSLDRVERDASCAALRTQDAIAADNWRLVTLVGDSAPITVPADSPATFSWDRADGRFAGNSGCNRFSASGVLRGTTLAARQPMGTKMACPEGTAMTIESRLLALLERPLGLRVQADTLVWSDGPVEVARFVRGMPGGE